MSAIFLLICILLEQLSDLNICHPFTQVSFCILTCSRQEEKVACLQRICQITKHVCHRGAWTWSTPQMNISIPSPATFTGGCRHCLVQIHLKKNIVMFLFFQTSPCFFEKTQNIKLTLNIHAQPYPPWALIVCSQKLGQMLLLWHLC